MSDPPERGEGEAGAQAITAALLSRCRLVPGPAPRVAAGLVAVRVTWARGGSPAEPACGWWAACSQPRWSLVSRSARVFLRGPPCAQHSLPRLDSAPKMWATRRLDAVARAIPSVFPAGPAPTCPPRAGPHVTAQPSAPWGPLSPFLPLPVPPSPSPANRWPVPRGPRPPTEPATQGLAAEGAGRTWRAASALRGQTFRESPRRAWRRRLPRLPPAPQYLPLCPLLT